MSRQHIDVPVPALGLRRAEAAAALGISVESFDSHVRPHVPVVRVGTVRTYPVAALQAWLASQAVSPVDEIRSRAA